MKTFRKSSAILALAVAGTLGFAVPSFSQMGQGDNTPTTPANDSTRTRVDNPNNPRDLDATNRNKLNDARLDNRQLADEKVAEAVRERLVSLINESVSKDSLNDVIGSFTKAHRERLEAEKFKDTAALNTSIERFRKDFRDKYSVDFDIKTSHLSALQVYRGANDDTASASLYSLMQDKDVKIDTAPLAKREDRVSAPAGTIADTANRTVDPNANTASPKRPNPRDNAEMRTDAVNKTDTRVDATRTEVARNPDGTLRTDTTRTETTRTDKLDPNAKDAHLADKLMKDLMFVKETHLGNAWRLEIAGAPTSQDLATALTKEIDAISAMKQDWPADVNQAYTKVGKHLLTAIQNASMKADPARQASVQPLR